MLIRLFILQWQWPIGCRSHFNTIHTELVYTNTNDMNGAAEYSIGSAISCISIRTQPTRRREKRIEQLRAGNISSGLPFAQYLPHGDVGCNAAAWKFHFERGCLSTHCNGRSYTPKQNRHTPITSTDSFGYVVVLLSNTLSFITVSILDWTFVLPFSEPKCVVRVLFDLKKAKMTSECFHMFDFSSKIFAQYCECGPLS